VNVPKRRANLTRAELAAAAMIVALCSVLTACHPAGQIGNGVPEGRLVIAVPQEPGLDPTRPQ
jgi:hypothetical protein